MTFTPGKPIWEDNVDKKWKSSYEFKEKSKEKFYFMLARAVKGNAREIMEKSAHLAMWVQGT